MKKKVYNINKKYSEKCESSCNIRYAKCMSIEDTVMCRCGRKYVEKWQNGNLTKCIKKVDECKDRKLNTCHQHADCTDQPIGYKCRCHDGYIDESRKVGFKKFGRICKLNKLVKIINNALLVKIKLLVLKNS